MSVFKQRVRSIREMVSKDSYPPILEVVERYTKMERHGDYFLGLCPHPDHDDHKPSFSVRPLQGLFNCFTCQRGGDVVQFLSWVEDIPLDEARAQLLDGRDVYLDVLRQMMSDGLGIEIPPPLGRERLSWDESAELLKSCPWWD